MGDVIGTLIVPFGQAVSSGSGNVVAEWDDTLNIDSTGEVKNQFVPTDKAWLLVHAPDVEILRVAATDGTVNNDGEDTLRRSQDIGFGDIDDGQDLQYLPASALQQQWLGRKGLGLQVAGRRLTVLDGFPCMLRATYMVRFRRYMLQTPNVSLTDKETYPLFVYIYYRESGA